MHEMFFVWNRSLLGFSIQWVEILESIFLGCTIVRIYWLMKSNTLSNLYVSWDCCLIEATICWSTIWIFIVFLKIWWNEKWKYEGMKTGNMMEWKSKIWRNEKRGLNPSYNTFFTNILLNILLEKSSSFILFSKYWSKFFSFSFTDSKCG